MTSRNFGQFLTPLPPIVTPFITMALVLSSQNPLPLRPWRHLWTNPYTSATSFSLVKFHFFYIKVKFCECHASLNDRFLTILEPSLKGARNWYGLILRNQKSTLTNLSQFLQFLKHGSGRRRPTGKQSPPGLSPQAASHLKDPEIWGFWRKISKKMFRHKKSQNYGRVMPQKITDQNDKKSRIKHLYKVICFLSFFKFLFKLGNII